MPAERSNQYSGLPNSLVSGANGVEAFLSDPGIAGTG